MTTPGPPVEFTFPESLLELPSFVMFQVLREARRIVHALGEEDLRLPHVAVLGCVGECGPISQKDISVRLRIDASDLVTVLDQLEQAGLISRARDVADRRRHAVTVTAAGRAALRRRIAMTERLEDNLLMPLSAAERNELHRLLLRVYAHHDPQRLPARFQPEAGAET
ncbi:MAG TPA: MarR family transcriptional regulator [Pseudonocardiaceae bacterium]|nr:MarR family transcriptional regulator [Pseudonocardiaceae bacterium]